MTLFERLTATAQAMPQRLVLPESKEPRTLQAADRILADKIATIIFVGHRDEIIAEAEKLGFGHIIIPKYNMSGLKHKKFGIELHPVRKVEEALRELFG